MAIERSHSDATLLGRVSCGNRTIELHRSARSDLPIDLVIRWRVSADDRERMAPCLLRLENARRLLAVLAQAIDEAERQAQPPMPEDAPDDAPRRPGQPPRSWTAQAHGWSQEAAQAYGERRGSR